MRHTAADSTEHSGGALRHSARHGGGRERGREREREKKEKKGTMWKGEM